MNQWRQISPASRRDAKAVFADKAGGHHFLPVRNPAQRSMPDRPAIGAIRFAHDDRHDRIVAFQGQFHGRFADRVGLFHIDSGCDVPCGALQVVCNRPVIFIAMLFPDHFRDDRPDATELGVAKGVPGPGFSQEAAIPRAGAFRYDDHAIFMLVDALLYPAQEPLLRKRHFRQQDDMRGIAGFFSGQARRGGYPSCMPAHDFKDEYLGRCARHRGHIQRSFAG